MTEQLLPDFHLKIRHRKADQTPVCNSGIRCVIREKRAACPLRYQLTEQLCIAGFQQRLDLQRPGGQTLVHQPPVAHPFFCQQKRIVQKLFYGKGGLLAKRTIRRCYKVGADLGFLDEAIFRIVNMAVQRQDKVYLIVPQELEKRRSPGSDDVQTDARIQGPESPEGSSQAAAQRVCRGSRT